MIRTQVYLTESERSGLKELAESTGRKPAELVRLAVDQFIAFHQVDRQKEARMKAAGMWRHREDLPDVEKLRDSWNRSSS